MGRCALVTGAGSGIGRACAHALARRRYDLILTGRDDERLKKTEEEIRSLGVRVRSLTADLTSREEVRRLYEETRSARPAFLVNCAGFGVYGGFAETELARELAQIDVNVTAVHMLTKLVLADMRRRNSGVILNVGSSAGFMAGPYFAGYYASKNYVVRLTEAVHEELRREGSGVRISVLCPGPVATSFDRNAGVGRSLRGLDPEYVAECGIRGALAGRMVTVPGTGMKAGLFLSHFAGERLLTRITGRIQKRKAGASLVVKPSRCRSCAAAEQSDGMCDAACEAGRRFTS